MYRFSASISSLRGGSSTNTDRKNGPASPTLPASQSTSEFGTRHGPGGLPPIPQKPRQQDQQDLKQQRRQSSQPGQTQQSTFTPPQSRRRSLVEQHNPPQVRSPTAGLHSLPATAQLLNARKVYKAGYLWRLDGHPSSSAHTGHGVNNGNTAAVPSSPSVNAATTQQPKPRFVKYYIRLEDCILCLWPDEGLKQAQSQGTFVHPSSMNLQDGFVARADAKREWASRAEEFDSPTPFTFVLNTAGNNSTTFATENEDELRQWINTIRLSIWERQRLETLYTAARLGIKEEQQLNPIKSAISFGSNIKGAKIGRAEGLIDVRLPGDTEWKRVYAVLTEPGIYKTANANTNSHPGTSSTNASNSSLPTSASSTSLASTTKKKEKRKSFMSSLLGGGGGSNSSNATSEFGRKNNTASSSSSNDANTSPVVASYNSQLEDPNVGPTLALFGILNSSPSPTSPNLRSSVDFSSSKSSSNTAGTQSQQSISSLPSNSLQLTKRPLCVINQVWSAYAVWPENEALIPHARTFKLHGRMTWLEQEVISYSQSSSSNSSIKNPISAFEEAMKRENSDLGKADNQIQLLCMLVGNENDSDSQGPSHAVRSQFKSDMGGELLSWILGFYDAFRLHGRPDRMLYDPRNPLSPYFAQPAGPTRGALYFDPPLVEDLPQFQDTHPRIISDGFMRILVDRMMKAYNGNGPSSGLPLPQSQISARDVEQYRREGPQGRNGNPSTPSTPPILPPIGETQNLNMGGQDTQTMSRTQGRNMNGPVSDLPQTGESERRNRQDTSSPNLQYTNEARQTPAISAAASARDPTADASILVGKETSRERSPRPEHEGSPYRQGEQSSVHDSQSRHGSPQTNYGQASPPRQQGDTTSVYSSPNRQGGNMLRPGSASSSDAQRHSPYLSSDRGENSRQGAISHRGASSSVLSSEHEQEQLQAGTDEQGTGGSYYNSRRPSRENTPAPSSRAPSALSSTAAVVHMPGGYIPTPDLSKSDGNGQQNAFALGQGSDARAAPRHQHAHHPSEQTLRGEAAAVSSPLSQHQQDQSPASEATPSTSAAMGSSYRTPASGPSSLADQGDRASREYRNDNTHDTALFDSPGALYAMSLDDSHRHDMSRDASSTASGQSQPSLSRLIMNRAAVANHPPSSDRSDSMASTADRTLSGGADYRQNTYGNNAPASAAPTSASDYSQPGTLAEPRSAAPSRSGSQHLPPSNLSQQVVNSSNTPPPNAPSLPAKQSSQEHRQTKASTTSTAPSEGQDDYLAALNYVAMAETEDQSHTRSTPRGTANGKPVISISTNGSKTAKDSNTNIRQPYSSTDTEPTSAGSPTYDEPLSPDSYGAYNEPAAPQMRVTNASPEKNPTKLQTSTTQQSRQVNMNAQGGSARRPGRGVPRVHKSAKKLGTWSSDEEEDNDSDKDSVDQEEEAERKKVAEQQKKAAEAAVIAEAERYKQARQREERPNHLRESTTSSGGGSLRRSLPGLPGPSTDPYLNRNTSPTSGMPPGQQSPYSHDMSQQQYAQFADANRGSMYGWPGQMQMQMPMGGGSVMSPPWQAQHQQRMSGGGSGFPYNNATSPYGNSPSPSAYNNGQIGMNQNTMLAHMPDNPETAAADGRAMRNAAIGQHGLLQNGMEQKQYKSAAQMEALAKETGGPLLQLEQKAPTPQGGLVGAIVNHERDRKRDGGLGATLTERDRERRMAEMRQRELDQMGQRQAYNGQGGPNFGIPGMPGMPTFGMPPAAYGGMGNADPAQMQQQIAMLAAQNAYLQAMAGFNQGGLMAGQGQPYISPPFSPQMGGYGAPGSFMGMAPQSQSPHQLQSNQDNYGRSSPSGQGGDRHGRQGSRAQSDFFNSRP